MPFKQQRYSQRTVNLGLQKTLLDVATSIKKLQKNNDTKVSLQKALNFLLLNVNKIILAFFIFVGIKIVILLSRNVFR